MSGTNEPVAQTVDAREHRTRTVTTAPPHQRRAYNNAAATYDAERYESTEGRYFNDLEIELLDEWLRPRPGVKILELPAGTGRVAVPLAIQPDQHVAAVPDASAQVHLRTAVEFPVHLSRRDRQSELARRGNSNRRPMLRSARTTRR